MKTSYKETAKQLGIKYRIWRYGLAHDHRSPMSNRKYFHIVRLDGWSFDPQEIVEAFANDPEFSIKYGETDGCIANCDRPAMLGAAVCEFHLHNPSHIPHPALTTERNTE